MPEHPQKQAEVPVTGRAPVEWIGDLEKVAEGEKSAGNADPLSSAVVGLLTPTMSYLGPQGKLIDQEFTPPGPENLKGPAGLAAFYGQTPYSDATWLLFANPLTMFLVGLGVGAYEAKLTARKRVSDSIDAAALKEENEKLKGALDELKKYAQQTETPGQMGGAYSNEVLTELIARTNYNSKRIREADKERLLRMPAEGAYQLSNSAPKGAS